MNYIGIIIITITKSGEYCHTTSSYCHVVLSWTPIECGPPFENVGVFVQMILFLMTTEPMVQNYLKYLDSTSKCLDHWRPF